ncbi:MAG: glycosyltransferase family 2 protein [Clostridium sp.]|nr:glycosyltransferase family 2 protein [Clostridium sp.]
MKLEVLISCMNQPDFALIQQSRITTDALMINQTNFESIDMIQTCGQTIRRFNTNDRGLSRSRNTALEHAVGDICLICDDDEIFTDHYETIICQAFERLPGADIIAFDLVNKVTRLTPWIQWVGWLKSLKLASYQLALKRSTILASGVRFDPLMGSGTGNGAGEENKFLLDCLRKGLRIYYVPQVIGEVCYGPSNWFSGYDETFFFQRGSSTRYMLGFAPAVVYGIYYIIAKRALYRDTISLPKATKALFRGIWENKIKKLAVGEP